MISYKSYKFILYINIVSQPVACLFIFFMISFVLQKVLLLMQSNLLISLSFMEHTFVFIHKNSKPNPRKF